MKIVFPSGVISSATPFVLFRFFKPPLTSRPFTSFVCNRRKSMNIELKKTEILASSSLSLSKIHRNPPLSPFFLSLSAWAVGWSWEPRPRRSMDDENESKNAQDIQRLLGNRSNVDQTWITDVHCKIRRII